MAGEPVPLEIDCAELKRRLDSHDELFLLDCREADEHQLVHIPQATLLPMSELADRVAELEPHRHKSIVVHCHHGGRSLNVVRWLRQQGFDRSQSLAGGIDRWAIEIDPSLARY